MSRSREPIWARPRRRGTDPGTAPGHRLPARPAAVGRRAPGVHPQDRDGAAGESSGLRRRSGLSGHLSREGSAHDHIERCRASVALSYADGMAKAAQLTGESDPHIVAVVGDGALTGGQAWEAPQQHRGGTGAAVGDRRHRQRTFVRTDRGRPCPAPGGPAHPRRLRAYGRPWQTGARGCRRAGADAVPHPAHGPGRHQGGPESGPGRRPRRVRDAALGLLRAGTALPR